MSIFLKIIGTTVSIIVMMVVLQMNVLSQNLCDAFFVEALKSQDVTLQTSTIRDMLYEYSCKSRSGSGNTSFDIPTKYGELAFGYSNSSVKKACDTYNRNFFSEFKNQLMFSYLPEEAFTLLQGCFGGLQMTASREGDRVTIRVVWTPRDDGTLAKVEGFTVLPENALKCGNPFKKGDTLTPGGKSVFCDIKSNQNILIGLNTTKGSKEVYIKKDLEIKREKYEWSYTARDGRYICRNQFQNEVGAYQIIGRRWISNLDLIAKGSCLWRYGKERLTYDGETLPQETDSWSYIGHRRKKELTKCVLNGSEIGEWQSCELDGTCSDAFAITSACAGRYGLSK